MLAQIRPLFETSEWIDEDWYKNEILNPIIEKLLYVKIVNTATGELASILTLDKKKYMWFPYSRNKEIREEIWRLSYFWFPHCLPQKVDIELWYKLVWNDCGKLSIDQLASFVEDTCTLGKIIKCAQEY